MTINAQSLIPSDVKIVERYFRKAFKDCTADLNRLLTQYDGDIDRAFDIMEAAILARK